MGKQTSEIVIKDLDKLINHVIHQEQGLSAGQIALLAALIGALSAILAQLIIFILTYRTENKKNKKKLISEERSLAFLIDRNFKQYVHYIVNSEYWYQVSVIFEDTKHADHSYQKTFENNQKALETMNIINVNLAEYFKVITQFMDGRNATELKTELQKLQDFKPRDTKEFEDIKIYAELREASKTEKEELKKVYNFYTEQFNKINSIMMKKPAANSG